MLVPTAIYVLDDAFIDLSVARQWSTIAKQIWSPIKPRNFVW